jgi:iron(III) transport system substrate-binding protein
MQPLTWLARAVLVVAALAGPALAQAPAAGPTAELALYEGADRLARLAAGAKREGTVVLYTSFAASNAERLAADFEKRYGVKLQVWRAGSDKVVSRALAEGKAQRYDADAILVGAPELEALNAEGLLQEVRSPAHAALVEGLLPAHRAYAPAYLNLFAHAYNTTQVRRDELPRTFADLLDPKWKGRLGIEAKNQEWFMAVVQDLGEARGVKLFQDIVARNGLSVRMGNSVLTNMVASGEVPLALTVHSYMPEQLKRRGAPIDWFVIEPAVVRANAIAVMRRAPHPHAALLFYEYLLSDGQAVLADMAYLPAVKREDSPLRNLRVRVLDAREVLDDNDRWTKLYEATIRGQR